MRSAYLKAIDNKIARYKAEKRAGIAIAAILAITLICVMMIHLDSTMKSFGTSGHLGV